MAITKNETVIATFEFEAEDATLKDYDKIMRKAMTVAKNAECLTAVSSMISRRQIQIIFTFQGVGYKFVDEMRGYLNRFIDSHKQAAYYQWSNESVMVNL